MSKVDKIQNQIDQKLPGMGKGGKRTRLMTAEFRVP